MKTAIVMVLIGLAYFIFEWIVERLERRWPESQHPTYFRDLKRGYFPEDLS